MNASDTTDFHSPEKSGRGKNKKPDRKAISVLIITAFLSSAGIGIFNPILPFIVQVYTKNQSTLAIMVGALSTIYVACQFLAAPGLGALSDRFGRRPLLLICLLGSALGYALFGLGGALWVLFLSRIIDGLTGGNFSILFAYIGDLIEPEERGKYFGLFGGIVGTGFILGPVVGALASHISLSAPAYIVAGTTTLNIFLGYFFLPESLRAEHRAARVSLGALNPLLGLNQALRMPHLRWLLAAGFFFAFPFAILQANSGVLIITSLHWGPANIGYMMTLLGVLDILMQGVLSGRLLSIFGEVKLTIAGLVCEMLAYLFIGSITFIPSPILLLSGTLLFGTGSGLLEPSLNGLVSRAAGPRQQGAVQGAVQSIQALAHMLGPLWAGLFFVQFGHASPYWSAALIVVLAIISILLARPTLNTGTDEKQIA